jgi:hypothetical protein
MSVSYSWYDRGYYRLNSERVEAVFIYEPVSSSLK